jgi:hypothetical protein
MVSEMASCFVVLIGVSQAVHDFAFTQHDSDQQHEEFG